MWVRLTEEKDGSAWPTYATPNTLDSLSPKSEEALMKEATEARIGRSRPANLRDQISNHMSWPTPSAGEAHCGYQNRNNGKIGTQESLSTVVVNQTFGGLTPQTSQMRLNPAWVEWLMGFPRGWTDLNASATPWFHSRQQKHGEYSTQHTWPTPRGIDGIVRHSKRWMQKRLDEKRDVDLTTAVYGRQTWPTPNCADAFTDKLKDSQQKPGSCHSVTLAQAAQLGKYEGRPREEYEKS